MILRGHYQNAYVTHDIERAKAEIGAQCGISDYACFDTDLEVTTAQGTQVQSTRVACAWIGNLQIELIQPVSGFVDCYLPFLPADPADCGARFHHISMRRDDLDAMRQDARESGYAVICEGGIPDIRFLYMDARAALGHYLEFLWATPAGWQMLGWPEGRPAN